MTTKWSAFSAGSAIQATDEVVGLQSSANVRWVWSAVKTYVIGAATAVLAIAAGKTVTISNTLTFAGTDSTVMTFPSTSATLARTDAGNAFTGSQTATGSVTALSGTAIPAAGAGSAALLVSSTANFGVFFGSGAPTVSAAKGSLYLRSDGSGVADRMYVNTNGTTGWTAVATAG